MITEQEKREHSQGRSPITDEVGAKIDALVSTLNIGDLIYVSLWSGATIVKYLGEKFKNKNYIFSYQEINGNEDYTYTHCIYRKLSDEEIQHELNLRLKEIEFLIKGTYEIEFFNEYKYE